MLQICNMVIFRGVNKYTACGPKKNKEKHQKTFQNIWILKKLAISLHPLSPLKMASSAKPVLSKFFKKKVIKKFGGLKIMTYLCTAFPL